MKYTIKNCNGNISDYKTLILNNRGINDVNGFLNIDSHCENNYEDLDNIQKGVDLLVKHINAKNEITLLVDCDPDGYTSSAILYQYLKKLIPDINISYILQEGKKHGLHDRIHLPITTDLLIVPDAGSEDYEQHEQWKHKGVDILVLDHHEAKMESEDAVVINNQLSKKYPNKSLSGVGVVYKFLQALDTEYWVENASEYLDLVAIGNISDVMDSRDFETRYYEDIGIKNITNKLIKAIIKRQEFQMKKMDGLNKISVAWYITPLLNSIIRYGTQEEKTLLFRALCQDTTEIETYEYKPRLKDTQPIQEDLYDHVARLAETCKKKQDKQRDDMIAIFEKNLSNISDKNKIIFQEYESDVDSTLTGVVASNLAQKYKRPVLLGKMDSLGFISGSGRNCSRFEEQNLRSSLESLGYFKYCSGHEGAFGFSIAQPKVRDMVKAFNEKYKDADVDDYYSVDWVFTPYNIPDTLIENVSEMRPLWGTNVEEPLWCIKDIVIDSDKVNIVGKSKSGRQVRVYKFVVNGVEYTNLNYKQDDKLVKLCDGWGTSNISLTVIGKFAVNEYNGKRTPQVIIEDYEVNGFEN